MLRAKSKAKPVASTEAPDLANRIKAVCSEAEQYIESKVRALKADPDHAILSVDWIRQDLRRRTGGHCHCRVVLSLLEKEADNE